MLHALHGHSWRLHRRRARWPRSQSQRSHASGWRHIIKRFLIDFSFVNPLAASNVSQASSRSLATAEARKTAKYSAIAHARGAKFFPMVMELTGGMGKGCAELIKKLQSVAGHQRAWAPIELVRGLKMELS